VRIPYFARAASTSGQFARTFSTGPLVPRIAENAATERVALLEKGARDIHAAHEKIRALEAASTHLRIKNWFMAAVLSGIGALCFELVKTIVEGLLHK